MITNPIKQKRNYNVARIMQRIGVDKIICTSIMTKRIIGFDAEQINRMYLNILLVMFIIFFVTFPCGILGQVWYWIVSFPDLCRLSYFGIRIDEKHIKKAQNHKLLGIHIDDRLSWSSHIDHLCSSISSKISLLRQNLSKYVSTDVQKKFYQGYISPLIYYGSVVWETTSSPNQDKIYQNMFQLMFKKVLPRIYFALNSLWISGMGDYLLTKP